MSFYSELAADAAALLAEFGAPAVLRRAADGDYDTNFAEVDDNGTQVYNTVAVRGEFKRSDIDGTQILATDVRLYVSPSLATAPLPGDRIAFDTETFIVVNSKPVKPGAVVLLHDVQCRNA